jgi:hypothetical protein
MALKGVFMASYSYNSVTLPLTVDGAPQSIILESREEARNTAQLFARLIPRGIISVRQHRFSWPDSRKQLVEKIKASAPLTQSEEYPPYLIIDCEAQGQGDNQQQLFERLQQLGHIAADEQIEDYIN